MILLSDQRDRNIRFLWSLLFGFVAFQTVVFEFNLEPEARFLKNVTFPILKGLRELIEGFLPTWMPQNSFVVQVIAGSVNLTVLHCLLSKGIGDRFILEKIHPNMSISLLTLLVRWVYNISRFVSASVLFFVIIDFSRYLNQLVEPISTMIVSGGTLYLLSRRVKTFAQINEPEPRKES